MFKAGNYVQKSQNRILQHCLNDCFVRLRDMRKKLLLMVQKSFLILSVMTGTASSYSQVQGKVEFEDLVVEVLTKNSEIKVAHFQIEQAEARVGSAKSKFMPKLSLSASQMEQDQQSVVGGPGGGVSQNGLTTKATAQVNLFNGFQDINRYEQKTKELEKSNLDMTLVSLAQKDRVISSIFKILIHQSDIQNIEEKLKIEGDREKDLKKRVLSQAAKRSDLLAVQSSILTSISDLQTAQSDLAKEWKNLNDLGGRQIPVRFILVSNQLMSKVNQEIPADKFPETRAALLDFQAAENSHQSARGQYLPSLEVSSNYYFSRPDSQKDNKWDYQVTASISIPIDGEKTNSVSEARAAANIKEAQYFAKRNSKELEFKKLVSEFNADTDRLATLSQSVEVQERLVEAFKKDYTSGLITISEYLSSVSQLLQKKQNKDRLFYQQLQRIIQIRNNITAAGENL